MKTPPLLVLPAGFENVPSSYTPPERRAHFAQSIAATASLNPRDAEAVTVAGLRQLSSRTPRPALFAPAG